MCQDCGREPSAETLTFDADGTLVPEPNLPIGPLRRACPVGVLNGSWLLEVQSLSPTIFRNRVRGALRIEVGPNVLRCSGDVYTARSVIGPFPEFEPVLEPLPFDAEEGDDTEGVEDDELRPIGRRPWYPAFPQDQYSWYFRSNGATYSGGTLTVNVVRHLWNRSAQDFAATDTGTLTLTCRRGIVAFPLTPQRMQGTLTIGGRTTDVTATKTSGMYRGCRVEVDVMTDRTFPASATIGSGALATLRSVYASAGWDVAVVPDQIDVPEDTQLTNAELAALLTAHRQAATGDAWRLWLLVGSAQGSLFGIMFDDDAVPREGAVGFADATLGNDSRIEAGARNRPLDEVPAAFLRTLVHEAGHALNLFHPKHDIHNPPIGIEIMNQTGDVIGFASAANPYPGNAGFVFAEHDLLSLRHAPDPQVRPGWKNFGWGHGTLSPGLPVPVDVAGLTQAGEEQDLVLGLTVPALVFVGEYVMVEVTLTNTGDTPREVTGRLNLAEGDVVLERTRPDGRFDHVLDVVVGCGPRRLVTLEPGETISGRSQVFFTNQGLTFDAPGRHMLIARVEVDPVTTVSSPPVAVDVRGPGTEAEVDISTSTLADGVGRAFALGDFGADDDVAAVLTGLAESHAGSETGAAGALVMANALARRFTDHSSGDVREPAPDESERFLRLATEGRSAVRAVELAVTVASPTEKDAPVVADTLAMVSGRAGGDGSAGFDASDDDLAAAERVAAEFRR